MHLKPWSRTDCLITILFAALVILFYWRILTPDLDDRQSFPPGDFSAQFWAFTTFEVRELSAGRLPLWNPYTFGGAPFWADVQSAVFYPPSLLTILLSAPWGFSLFALEIEAIAHFWLAASFMYLFLRQITASRAAALIGSLTFTFSGYLTGYPGQQLAVLEADVWLPLILFFLHRAGEHLRQIEGDRLQATSRASIPLLILAGVAWGMTLLAGHPQSALIVAYLSSAYFFFLWWTRWQPGARRRPIFSGMLRSVSHWLIFLVAGLGLAAIQFLPAVEYTLHSVRAEGSYEAMSGGLPLTDLIQVLLPGQVSFYSPLYVGIVGLILAMFATFAVTARHRHTIFWAIVALVTLLISFGGNTFLYSPLYLFTPGFSIFRGQERWAFATAFSLSVLASYGFKTLLSQIAGSKEADSRAANNTQHAVRNMQLEIRNSQTATHKSGLHQHKSIFHPSRLTQYLFLFALLLTFLFFFGLNNTGWTPDSPFYGLLGTATLLTILSALAWLLWRFSTRLPPPVLTGLAALLICFDLFTANWQTNLYPQPPEWHTRMPDAVKAIKLDAAASPAEPFRVYNEFRLYDNYGVPFEIEDLWGASPLRSNRYDQFLAPPMPIERAWELLNVKYVITWREELFVPSTIIHQEPAEDGATYVHRLKEVGPRAWLVTRAEIADDETILRTIASPEFDRWQVALLEPEAEAQLAPLNQADLEDVSTNRLTTTQFRFDSPQSLSARVSTDTPALLVFSEIHYPGWQAGVDGQTVSLLRANYVLRAVPIPAGEHTVELFFRPLSFIAGAIISALTVIVIVVVLIFWLRSPRPPVSEVATHSGL